MRSTLITLIILLLGMPLGTMAQTEGESDTASAEAAEHRKVLREELAAARREVAEAARKLARVRRQLADMNLEVLRIGELKTLDEQMRALEGGVADVGSLMNTEVIRRLRLQHGPPRLGVLLGGKDDTNEIVGVTPGTGAEKAGIHAGDRLISINGKMVDASERASLRVAMEGIEAGDSVPVEIERAGERIALDVEVSSPARDFHVLMRDIPAPPLAPDAPHIEREVIIADGERHLKPEPPMPQLPPHLAGLGRHSDLVSNHAGLEPYFGTSEGVLVLRIDADNSLKLQDGDVVLMIDGEAVSRPVEIGRGLLGRGGQTVTLEVMRGGERVTIEAEVPESRAVSVYFQKRHHEL